MAEIKKINTDLQLEGRLLDGNGSAGTSGQILSSTGTATDWISLSEISGVDGDGTANTVAMWSDDDTITDAPITISGNNATFTGNIHLDNDSSQLQFGDDNDMQIYHNGAGGEINNALGSFTIDSAGDIALDADGGDIRLYDGGVLYGNLANGAGHFQIKNPTQDMNISFVGNDGGSTVNALTLDMSEGGNATFAGDVTVNGGDVTIKKQNDAPTITLLHDGTNPSTNDLLFKMQFQSDYNGSHENWGKIELNTNSSSVRTNLDFYVKSTSGNEELGLRIEGGSTTPKTYIYGDLIVEGDTTTLNTQTVEVEDNILQLNTTQGSPDTATATTSGISIYRGSGVTQASFIFDDADDTWDLTNNLAVAGNVTISKSVGDAVLTIEADTDNNNENDNPRIELKQDSGIIYGHFGINGDANNTFTGAGANSTYIRAAGGLDIATSGSTKALTIDTSQNATFAGDVAVQGTGDSYFTGNVGIGTTNPDYTLDIEKSGANARINSTTGNAILNLSSQDASSTIIEFGDGDDNNIGKIQYRNSNDSMSFTTNASEAMRIDSDGDVGIGKTSPGYKLDVEGSQANVARFTSTGNTGGFLLKNSGTTDTVAIQSQNDNLQFRVDNGYIDLKTNTGATATSRMRILSNGNVGIGTTSPGEKLEVVGNIFFNGLLYGGFGAKTTSGTLDWNDSSNARSGGGYTLLRGNATNGPSGTAEYYHPFSFEYSTKNGSGNLTQFAIPYSTNDTGIYFRNRYSSTWTGWSEIWTSNNDGAGSGLDADLLDAQHGSYYLDYNNFTNTPTIPSAYNHPTHPGDDFSVDTGALTGAWVVSDIDINVTTDTLGHVTDANGVVATRQLTAGDIGAAASSHTHAASDITSGVLDNARIAEFLPDKHIYSVNEHGLANKGIYMPMVKGGQYATSTSSITGQILIKIPSYKADMMQQFYVDIYEYETGESLTFRISGYSYSDTAANWYNTSVVNLSDDTDRDFTVRFGADTTNNFQYVAIGETNSTWSYPQVNIRDFLGGYNTSAGESQGSWDISFVTSTPGSVSRTHSDNLVSTQWANIADKPSTFPPSSHTHAAADITSGTFADARIALSNITQHTDPKYLRSNANDSFSGLLTSTLTTSNALEVGGIRGLALGSQTGDYIHLYERVHIGYPGGWGASQATAPSSGLGVWGSIDLGMSGSGVLQMDGTTVLTAARVLQNVTNTNWDSAYTYSQVGHLPLSGGTIDGTLVIDTDTGANPLTITRLGSASQSLKIWVDDSIARFQHEQDEDTGVYGSFRFIGDAGATNPVFDWYHGATERASLDLGNGNLTLTGTLTASGYNDSNWNTAYNNSIVSAAVTGTTTKTLTLTQQDAGTVTASWTDLEGVASVSSGDGIVLTGTSGSPTVNIDYSGTDNAILTAVDASGSTIATGAKIWYSDDGTIAHANVSDLPFASSSHNHDSDYVNVSGDTMTGDLYLDDGSGATPSLYFKNGADNFWRYLMESGGDFSVKEGTSTRLTFQAGGNVGIGTTSPSAKLDIGGNIKFTNGSADNYITTDSNASKFRIFGGSSNSVSNGAALTLHGHTNTGDAGVADLASTTAGFIRFRIGTDEKMRITSTGNVGIGTTSPGSELEVDGEITTTTITYPEPSAVDSSAYNGEIVYFGSFESGIIGAGTLMSLGNDGSANIRWYKADDNTTSRATGLLGISLGTSASAGLLVRGIAKNSAWSSFTAGDKLYLSPTDGSISNSITGDTNDYVRIVGYALGSSKIYFCPDNTYIQNS